MIIKKYPHKYDFVLKIASFLFENHYALKYDVTTFFCTVLLMDSEMVQTSRKLSDSIPSLFRNMQHFKTKNSKKVILKVVDRGSLRCVKAKKTDYHSVLSHSGPKVKKLCDKKCVYEWLHDYHKGLNLCFKKNRCS